MTSKRSVFHVLLALLVILAQEVVLVHAVNHQAKPRAVKYDPLARDAHYCHTCALAAQFGNALTEPAKAVPVERQGIVAVVDAVSVFVPPVVLAYSSRAPPAILPFAF
jgi:hypothetical protein